MPTLRQRKLAKAVIDGLQQTPPPTMMELANSAGYAPITAETHSTRLLQQKGTIEALEEYGFSEEKAKRRVGQILAKGADRNSLTAADMVFRVHGTYAPERRLNVNMDIDKEGLEELTAKAHKVGMEIVDEYREPETLDGSPKSIDDAAE